MLKIAVSVILMPVVLTGKQMAVQSMGRHLPRKEQS